MHCMIIVIIMGDMRRSGVNYLFTLTIGSHIMWVVVRVDMIMNSVCYSGFGIVDFCLSVHVADVW